MAEKILMDNNSCPVCALRAFITEALDGLYHNPPKEGLPANTGINFEKLEQMAKANTSPGLVEDIALEVKAKGWMRADLEVCATELNGIVGDLALDAKIPIGSILPAFRVKVDVCSKCGSVYAVKIIRTEVKKSLNLIPPSNRT
jgi:ribosomal protein S27AE